MSVDSRTMLVLLVCVLVAGVSTKRHAKQEHVMIRRQVNIGNIDAALRNPSFVRFQLACLLERGSCDRIGQRIRNLLPEIVGTGHCSQCTNHEVNQAGKVMLFIQENYPREYNQLERKYSSDNHLGDEER